MFATNTQPKRPFGSMSGPVDGVVDYSLRPVHAERKHRQIIEEIETCDLPEDVDEVLCEHDEILDNFYLNFPDYADAIKQAATDWKAMLRPEPAPSGAPVIAQSTESQTQEKIMFATNQTEGSQGPWMTWTSNGSAQKGFAPKSWIMRGTENDTKFERVIEGFANPCVFDLDTLKLGWEKDGAAGMAPERVYSSHYSVAMPRPDESKKPSGAFTWSNALQVRVAISKEQAVTWEQGSFGAYQAFIGLSKQIEAQWDHSQNGKLLPVVQMTDVETRVLKSGSTNIPILTIVKWAERPASLLSDAPAIASNVAAEQAAAATQSAAAVQAPAMAAGDF